MGPIEQALQAASTQLSGAGPVLDFAAIQTSLRALLSISGAIAEGLEMLAEQVESIDRR